MVVCSICSQTYKDLCGNCIAIQQTCILCFTKFETDETVIRCKECHYLGHKDNFSAWLSKHGSCPVCRIDYNEQLFDEITLTNGTIKQLYLDKSSVYFKRNEIFSEFKFRLPYFEFQEEIVEDIHAQLKFDDSHLLISPPGSGKTIIGLSMTSLFSVHTLILVPNLAVLGSWVDRLSMFYDHDESTLKLAEVYTRTKGDLKPITIVTYQQINSSLKDYVKPEIKGKKAKGEGKSKIITIDNSGLNFIDRLVNHNIGLIILDEAHRLTGKWGDNILELIKLIGDVKLLGLTATPPQKLDDEFDQLFNGRKTQIPLPMMVREGVLVPFRDYALTFPDFHYFTSRLQILEIKEGQKTLTDMESEEYNLIIQTIEELRLISSKTTNDYHARWLSANMSYYLQMVMEVLDFEIRNMKSDFRGLIILEQENLPTNYGYDLKGIGGAIGLFNYILKHRVVNNIDPVFVTGSSVLIDSDLNDNFKKLGIEWIDNHGLDMDFMIRKTKHGYSIVKGKGNDWNTDTYTRYITHLFDRGYTKLLVGTRFLLGEGWDSQVLNTVLDMTSITTYAFVNQVKGRALRKDPNRPDKVSNIWEFAPNYNLNKITSKEYSNFQERHHIYFGINENGEIVNGIDRLQPRMPSQRWKTPISVFDMAMDRKSAIALWKVGVKLGDLFYVLNFTINPPVELKNLMRINEYARMHEIEILIRETLSDLIFQQRDFDIYLKIKFDHKSMEILVKIAVPISVDYNQLLENKQKLVENTPTDALAIIVRYHRNQSWWATFINTVKGRPIPTYFTEFCFVLPLQASLISSQEIVSKGDNFKNYIIKKVNTIKMKILPTPDPLILNNKRMFAAKYKYKESSIIQVIHKSKQIEAIGPLDNYLYFEIGEVRIDQEYIDDDDIDKMEKL